MAFFTKRKTFLIPCFDIDLKEEKKLVKFLKFLENLSHSLLKKFHINGCLKKEKKQTKNYIKLNKRSLFKNPNLIQ